MSNEPEEDSFVVWIDPACTPPDTLRGRVECVRSAERAPFQGRDELLTLIERWASRARPDEIETGPRGR